MSAVFNESTTPSPRETRWRIRAKMIKQARTNLSDTASSTEPRYADTKRQQFYKLNRIFSGSD